MFCSLLSSRFYIFFSLIYVDVDLTIFESDVHYRSTSIMPSKVVEFHYIVGGPTSRSSRSAFIVFSLPLRVRRSSRRTFSEAFHIKNSPIVFSTPLKHFLLLCFIKLFLFLQTLNFLKICFMCFLIIFVIIKLYNRVIIIKKY